MAGIVPGEMYDAIFGGRDVHSEWVRWCMAERRFSLGF